MKCFYLLALLCLPFTCLAGDVGKDPAAVRPILNGAVLPPITLQNAAGEDVDLNALVAEKPTVLLVYRGGWCPYCNTHLGKIQGIQPALVALGYQVLAVSPDRPEKLREAREAHSFSYSLLSDSSMAAGRALGLAFQVDDALVEKYKSQYGIDLEADSGQTHHQLPVPAAFVLNQEGRVEFSHVNPDYKSRVDPDVLLTAAKAALKPVSAGSR
jgi:peroxiredoxin